MAGFEGRLRVSSTFHVSGIDPSEVLLLRNTFKKDGLTGPDGLTPAMDMAYVREQRVKFLHIANLGTSQLVNHLVIRRYMDTKATFDEARTERQEWSQLQ